MNDTQTKPKRGCLFYGCIVGAFLLLVFVLAALLGIRYARNMIQDFTETQAASLPTVQFSDEQLTRLRERVNDFKEAVQSDLPVEPLSLTADELNALIATEPDLAPLKGRLYISLPNDHVEAQMSVSAEELGLERLRGRYVNGTGTFSIGLRNNQLEIEAQSLMVKGRPVPENIMRHIRARNLGSELNSNPRVGIALRKLQSIEVKDSKLILTPKKS